MDISGGTPVGRGQMRQRHSSGYASSGDDLEDDACSRHLYFSPSLPESRTWFESVEIFLWIASVIFIIYYGDRHSNFIYLLCHDNRIRRSKKPFLVVGLICFWKYVFCYFSRLGYKLPKSGFCDYCRQCWIPLYIGMLCVSLNVLFFLYRSLLASGIQKPSWKWEISSMAALPFITMLGVTSFFLFTFALWPIWSFLTLPLVFTLFMATMVVLPHAILGTFNQQPELLRTD